MIRNVIIFLVLATVFLLSRLGVCGMLPFFFCLFIGLTIDDVVWPLLLDFCGFVCILWWVDVFFFFLYKFVIILYYLIPYALGL
ncbi:hypothetical protein GGR57DRAFT_483308 [Xylariaceae sp. FL1272]|nr:hypothetical protein GGR57DRAFT_483308 [Xylariaceae sp. FL1272]